MAQWKRVTRLSPCPVCTKTDWCLISPDRSAVICPRIEEGSTRYVEGSGNLHILRVTKEWMDEKHIPCTVKPLPEHNEVLAIRARNWITKCERNNTEELSKKLGVSEESLKLLNLGWLDNSSSWVFPMLRKRDRLIGIRVRPRNGKKFAIKGSRNGLFVPNNLPDKGVVYICEGESDTAAMLTCGLNAVGRPSCNSGDRLLAELLVNHEAVICMDRDGVGRKGALSLLDYLKCHLGDVRLLEPPDKYKDMRDWLHGEGKEQVYDAAIRVYG
jgi:hypothetical protein